jgi:hypothetical protein
MKALVNFLNSEKGDLAAMAIGLTIFLVVVGYVLAPVGLTAMTGVNTTTAGVATGTNASIWNALVPISLAALIIGVIYAFKSRS